MTTHLEESLERDIERIKTEVRAMSSIAERSLRDCVRAFVEDDRHLAYAVILRDQHIDEKEKTIDQLCLEFLVRQQPVGAPLRLVYSTIKMNLELERVGDYAESVARQVVKLGKFPPAPEVLKQWITEMAERAIPMLHDSVQAFVQQDPQLATNVIVREPAVDALLGKLNGEIVEALRADGAAQRAMVGVGIAVQAMGRLGHRLDRVAGAGAASVDAETPSERSTRTLAPSRRFRRPSTTIVSPAVRPLTTSTQPTSRASSLTSRCSTVSSLRTT
mgnify:CR=1 FL=1